MSNRIEIYFNARDDWDEPEKINNVKTFSYFDNGFFVVRSINRTYFFQSDIIDKVIVYGNNDFVDEIQSDFVFPFPLVIVTDYSA